MTFISRHRPCCTLLWLHIACGALFSSFIPAALGENNTSTNFVADALFDNYWLGVSGTNNTATVAPGIALSFKNNSGIGQGVTACGNTLTLQKNSHLYSQGDYSGDLHYNYFNLGYSGSGNRLIASTANVSVVCMYLGRESLSCSNECRLQEGWLFVDDKLTVGDAGAYNQLVVSGGWVEVGGSSTLASYPELHIGTSGSSKGNRVVLEKSSTLRVLPHLSMGGDIVLGSDKNALVVDSSTVYAHSLWLAGRADYVRVTNSSLFCVWYDFCLSGVSNCLSLAPGVNAFGKGIYMDGYRNTVSVEGGSLEVSEESYIGYFFPGTGSCVRVSGPGAFFGCPLLDVGGVGTSNSLWITGGGCVSNAQAYIGEGSFLDECNKGGLVVVAGTGSLWKCGALQMGSYAPDNALVVSNGGQVQSGPFLIGHGNFRNRVVISGPGSGVDCGGDDLSVGWLYDWNELRIEKGATVTNGAGWVGYSEASDNNVTVTGSGSVWTCQGSLILGDNGGSDWNQLQVETGGKVRAASCTVGQTGKFNGIDVRGVGSLFETGDLIVGKAGQTCHLTVSDGARASVGNVWLGLSSQAVSNEIGVVGAGTVWSNSGNLAVGTTGAYYNVAYVSDGAVMCVTGSVSVQGRDCGLLIWGTDSRLRCGPLHVGTDGSTNAMAMALSGRVDSDAGFIGSAGSFASIMEVDGWGGGCWTNRGNLYMDGRASALRVAFAGAVYCATGYMGMGSAPCATARLDGAGSIWQAQRIIVGVSSSSNVLMVSTGAVVKCGSLVVGYSGSRSANEIRVLGAGATVHCSGDLSVGIKGSFHRLLIENGGCVEDTNGRISEDTRANGNLVRVSGANSVWTNSNLLWVGAGGELSVETGGKALAPTVTLVSGSCLSLSNGFVKTGSLDIGLGARLRGGGSITGSVASAGWIDPGFSAAGTIAVTGTLALSASSLLSFDVGGSGTDLADRIDISDVFTRGGTVSVQIASNWMAPTGSYCLMTHRSAKSGFIASNLPAYYSCVLTPTATALWFRITGYQTTSHGVPIPWLIEKGWTTDFEQAEADDQDGDRMATWKEYFAGTDPKDPESNLRILKISSAGEAGAEKELRWNGVSNRTYAIFGSTNLSAPWFEIATNIPPEGVWTDRVHGGKALMMYRVWINR